MLNAAERWYSNEQIKQGEIVFKSICGTCHGQNAEATPNWRTTDANGKYPPPPLDGSAHAWHHSIDLLRKTVREGGIQLGGSMPAFEKVLSAQQIDQAIAYFQSKWSDEIYDRWSGKFETTTLPSLDDISKINKTPKVPSLTRLLKQRMGNKAKIGMPTKTELQGVWKINVNGQSIFLLNNGKHAMLGNLVNLETGAQQ